MLHMVLGGLSVFHDLKSWRAERRLTRLWRGVAKNHPGITAVKPRVSQEAGCYVEWGGSARPGRSRPSAIIARQIGEHQWFKPPTEVEIDSQFV